MKIDYNKDTTTINNSNIKEFINSISKNRFVEHYPHQVLIVTSNADYPINGNRIYVSILSKFGMHPYSKDYRSLLSRLLLHPTREIMTAILQIINLKDYNNCIGIQIRMGGENAESKENFVFLTKEAVVKNINQIAQRYKHKERFYISTDSPGIISTVKEILYPHEIIQFTKYKIGHSSSIYRNNTLDTIKRAISDAIIISNCNTLFLTNYSSYGHLIGWLTSSNTKKYLMYNIN